MGASLTARGYAAIAIDHGGCIPEELGEKHDYTRLENGGPETVVDFRKLAYQFLIVELSCSRKRHTLTFFTAQSTRSRC